MKEKAELIELTVTQKEPMALFLEMEQKIKVLVNKPVIDLESIFKIIAGKTRTAFETGVWHLLGASAKNYQLENFDIINGKEQSLDLFQANFSPTHVEETHTLGKETDMHRKIPLYKIKLPSPVNDFQQKEQKTSKQNAQDQENSSSPTIAKKLGMKTSSNQEFPIADIDKGLHLLEKSLNLRSEFNKRNLSIENKINEIFSAEQTTNQRENEEKPTELFNQTQGAAKPTGTTKSNSVETKKTANGKIVPGLQLLECSGMQMSISYSPQKFWRKKETIVLEPLNHEVENVEKQPPIRRSSIAANHSIFNTQNEKQPKMGHFRKEKSLEPIQTTIKSVKSMERLEKAQYSLRVLSPTIALSNGANLYDLLDLEHKNFPSHDLKKMTKEKLISELTVMNIEIKKSRNNYLSKLKKYCAANPSRCQQFQNITHDMNVASKFLKTWENRRQSENTLNNCKIKANTPEKADFDLRKTSRTFRNSSDQINISPKLFDKNKESKALEDALSTANSLQASHQSIRKNKYSSSARNSIHLIPPEVGQNPFSSIPNNSSTDRLIGIKTPKSLTLPKLEFFKRSNDSIGSFGQDFCEPYSAASKHKVVDTCRNSFTSNSTRFLESLQTKNSLREA